ncbi:MAG: hypothetical protein M1829_003000 [Trizodia sp. TS-e1964]|nr:MAG: hypothetical protein M1829_003000 [Trizodia sp. TS-e1964]
MADNDSTKPKKEGKASKGDKSSKAEQHAQKKGAKPSKPNAGEIQYKKAEDFTNWYRDAIRKANFIGDIKIQYCPVLRPASYSIWERIQDFVNKEIKAMGVENYYFPLFLTRKMLETEEDNLEGFQSEVAWVTRFGDVEFPKDKELALRPTSETAFYTLFKDVITSYRDLPLKTNQWANVVRWETTNPMPFTRTREFLWQEGHTAHATEAEAQIQVTDSLEMYHAIYEKLLAVPVIKGQKTKKETFPGAVYTKTIEAYLPSSGRAIQAATSHYLSQKFSIPFDIVADDDVGTKFHPYTTSWGITTRSIGVMAMVHGDDKGLIVPPVVSRFQVLVASVGMSSRDHPEEMKKIEEIVIRLQKHGIRVHKDLGVDTARAKWIAWEMSGVPLRLEIGVKELDKGTVTSKRRDLDGPNGKQEILLSEVETAVERILQEIQVNLLAVARVEFDNHIKEIVDWNDFVPALDAKNLILTPHCLEEECEEWVKSNSRKKDEVKQIEVAGVGDHVKEASMGAKSLCVPDDQPVLKEGTKCLRPDCKSEKAKAWCLFGRCY